MKLGDRVGAYILERPLGKGEIGTTWIARRSSDAPLEVVLKIFELGEAKGWTGFELFKREVEAIETLSHPGIPRFIERFEDGSGGDTRLTLAMELAPGNNLQAEVEGGRRFTEAEIVSILASLADILAYLGSLRPPVVHRDVNPRNVVLGPSGKVFLVDFSGALEVLRSANAACATLIGTAGYIPLEQIAGRASPRTDLFGAAATALFLLTRRNPSEFPVRNLKPDLSALPTIGPSLRAVLDSWLEPDEAKRDILPADAVKILRGELTPPDIRGASPGDEIDIRLDDTPSNVPLPSDSKVKISEYDGSLHISIPAAGFANPASLAMGGFSVFWLGFVAFWTFGAISMGAPIFFPIFSIPFWAVGIFMIRNATSSIFKRYELLLVPEQGLILKERSLGIGKTRSWPLTDIGACTVESATFATKGVAEKELVIEAGAKRLRLGKSLSERELRALATKIESWRATTT